jgi:pimeloyl-ACP methyl ester carboxylesterase
MSAINIGGELIHYEVLGRGRPVVLIHSWLGSWRYWVPTMQNLQVKYRVYALDLHGFGDTSKNPGKYSLDSQVKLLADFLGAMAIPKAAIIGHGFGAWVAAEFARLYPDNAPRIMLISAPLFNLPGLDRRVRPGRTPVAPNRPSSVPIITEATIMNSRTSAWMRERMRLAMESAEVVSDLPEIPPPQQNTAPTYNPLQTIIGNVTPDGLLQRCFSRSEPFYEKLSMDIPKTDPRVLAIGVESFDAGRVLDNIWLLPMPTLIVHGAEDSLIALPGEDVWHYVTHDKEDRLLPIELPGIGHFPMLESERFIRLVNDFLEAPDISKLEIKERWRRRSR